MGIFDKVDTESTTVADKDTVRGQKRKPLPSSIQNLVIKAAFAETKKSGALFVNVHFEVADGDNKERTLRISECIASGDEKGNKPYYMRKGKDGNMEKVDLPGFALINSLAQHVTGDGIFKCASEKKTIKLYDFDKKEEVPTEVDMFSALVGKGICGCVLHRVEDKTKQNAGTGKYEPTGQTYEINVIDKFLHPSNRKTVAENSNNVDAAFKDQWIARWEGQIDDQSSEVKNAGLKGAPAAAGDNAEKTDLFA